MAAHQVEDLAMIAACGRLGVQMTEGGPVVVGLADRAVAHEVQKVEIEGLLLQRIPTSQS